MDSRKFFEHFNSNDKLGIIKNGFQFSDFNPPPNIKIYEIVRSVINNYGYELLRCQQNGIPLDKNLNVEKKMSYCTGFDILISNLLGIYGYEFCKYILFKINFKNVLNNYIKIIEEKSVNFNTLQLYLENFVKLYMSMKIRIINFDKFEEDYLKTVFGNKHRSTDISEIFREMFSDIQRQYSDIINFEEIKLAILDVLRIVIKHAITTKITINTLDDLIVNFGNIDIDIGYRDSFLRIAEIMYKNGNCPDDILIEYDLKNKINQFVKNIEQWLNNLIDNIAKLYPTIKLNVDPGLLTYVSEILIDWFINLSINIATLYNITINFEKASRIHFKTIYNAIIINTPKYIYYNPSQLTLIHYALLSKNSITKTLTLLNKSNDKKKGKK